MKTQALSIADLDAIAFGNGPGSFTGVRIACGVAMGMAMGANLPLAPVCSLQALAQDCGRERVLSCLDARMGEIYLAAYRKDAGHWREEIAPMLCKPDEGPLLEDSDWYGVGSGFAVHRDALRARYGAALAQHDSTLFPHARAVAQLGQAVMAAGGGVPPAQAAPLYLRDRVALTSAQRARGERL